MSKTCNLLSTIHFQWPKRSPPSMLPPMQPPSTSGANSTSVLPCSLSPINNSKKCQNITNLTSKRLCTRHSKSLTPSPHKDNNNKRNSNGHANHLLCSRSSSSRSSSNSRTNTATLTAHAPTMAPPMALESAAVTAELKFDSMYAIPPPNYRRDPMRSAEKLL